MEGLEYEHDDDDYTRRRLLGDTISSYQLCSTADPCNTGQTLSTSDSMKYGMDTLCGKDDVTNKDDLEAGLFRKHISQNAVKSFLVSTGSLDIYDSDGVSTSYTDYVSATEPCIAINGRDHIIYTIGGYNKSTNLSVNTIEKFIISDVGIVTSSETLTITLPEARFAAACDYWVNSDGDEYLVVIGGIKQYDHLNSNKNEWYQDIKLINLDDGTATSSGSTALIVDPERGSSAKLQDYKPWIEGDILYLWG
eukprot:156766_1